MVRTGRPAPVLPLLEHGCRQRGHRGRREADAGTGCRQLKGALQVYPLPRIALPAEDEPPAAAVGEPQPPLLGDLLWREGLVAHRAEGPEPHQTITAFLRKSSRSTPPSS